MYEILNHLFKIDMLGTQLACSTQNTSQYFFYYYMFNNVSVERMHKIQNQEENLTRSF